MNKNILLWIFVFIVLICPVFAVLNDAIASYSFTNGNAYDDTGNNNNGIVFGAKGINGQTNNPAFNFNGTTDYINLTGITSALTTQTISLWYNATTNVGNQYLLDIQTGRTILLFNQGAAGQVSLYDGGFKNFGSIPGANVFHHYTLVLNSSSSQAKLYVDGVQLGSTLVWSNNAIGGNIGLCSVNSYNSNFCNGIMDQVIFYDRALSQSEITELYNGGIILNPYESDNFTIKISDSYNSSSLNVNVEMLYNGTIYSFNGTNIDTGLTDSTFLANITISKDGYNTLTYVNYNISNPINRNINLTLGRFIFNNSITSYNGDSINSFNATITSTTTGVIYLCNTTNGQAICLIPKNDEYNISVNVLGEYASNSILQYYDTNISVNVQNISLFTYNSIRINIYDLDTSSFLIQNITIITIGNTTSFVNNTINGSLYIDLLSPSTYEIRVSTENYTTQSRFLTVIDDSTNLINIYMVKNDSTEIQEIHILDSSNTDIEGGVLWVQKQILGDTLWVTTQEVLSDFNGRSYIYIEKNPFVYYRFAVIYDGQQRPILPNNNLFTGKTSFISGLSEVVEILISLESDPDTVLTDFNGIITNLYYTGNETTIHFTWTDAQNSIYGGNLTVECKYINNLSNYDVCYSSQLNAISGELNYTFPDINNSIYRISGYILTNINNQILFEQTIKRVDVKSLVDESTGFLILAALIPLIALVALEFGIITSIIAIGLTLTAFNLMNIVTLAPSIITGFVCLGFILFLRFKKNVE